MIAFQRQEGTALGKLSFMEGLDDRLRPYVYFLSPLYHIGILPGTLVRYQYIGELLKSVIHKTIFTVFLQLLGIMMGKNRIFSTVRFISSISML